MNLGCAQVDSTPFSLFSAPQILVIDDDPMQRDTIEGILQANGYRTLCAENGEKGVALARTHFPDLVICDVHMECGDGFTALAELRQDERTATIPFILMTGAADPIAMRRGMEQGADDYLAKPFSLETLIATLEARLRKQRLLKQQSEKKLADLRAQISLMLPHELRTPLAGILGLAEVLANSRTPIQPKDLITLGGTLLEAGHRLERLVQNFLVYAQTELLESTCNRADVPCPLSGSAFKATLRQVCEKYADSHHRQKDLTLNLQEASAAVPPEILEKIAAELLDNAFKFSHPGDSVQVLTELCKDRLVLEVRDSGRGMTAEQVAGIGAFQQFFRRVYQQPGMGLGLVVSKNLIEVHGGTFQIRSSPGKGTTVRVILPQQPERAVSES